MPVLQYAVHANYYSYGSARAGITVCVWMEYQGIWKEALCWIFGYNDFQPQLCFFQDCCFIFFMIHLDISIVALCCAKALLHLPLPYCFTFHLSIIKPLLVTILYTSCHDVLLPTSLSCMLSELLPKKDGLCIERIREHFKTTGAIEACENWIMQCCTELNESSLNTRTHLDPSFLSSFCCFLVQFLFVFRIATSS